MEVVFVVASSTNTQIPLLRTNKTQRLKSRWLKSLANRPLPSSKNPHFQNEAKCTTFLVKINFVCSGVRIVFISKAGHLTSFWKRGPGELGNDLVRHVKVFSRLLEVNGNWWKLKLNGLWHRKILILEHYFVNIILWTINAFRDMSLKIRKSV